MHKQLLMFIFCYTKMKYSIEKYVRLKQCVTEKVFLKGIEWNTLNVHKSFLTRLATTKFPSEQQIQFSDSKYAAHTFLYFSICIGFFVMTRSQPFGCSVVTYYIQAELYLLPSPAAYSKPNLNMLIWCCLEYTHITHKAVLKDNKRHMTHIFKIILRTISKI